MRFRLGLLLGLVIGYVLGAKAGRERYAQIQRMARQLSRSEPAQHLSGEVRSVASRVGEQLESKATEKVKDLESKASEKVTRLTQAVRTNGGENDEPQAQS